jgi:hypothetical protein
MLFQNFNPQKLPFTVNRAIQKCQDEETLQLIVQAATDKLKKLTVAPEGFERNLITGYARREMPTVEELNKLLSYEPDTGELRWKVNRGRGVKAGDRAGSLHLSTGYRRIKIEGKEFCYHQICLILGTQQPLKLFDQHGYELVVDHINGIKDDNRLENLTEITVSENITKQLREQLKLDRDGRQLLTGIERNGTKYQVNFRIRSWWRHKTENGGSKIRIPFDTYAEAVIFKLFMSRFPHGDKIVEALDLNAHDELTLDKLYSGELAKRGHTIKPLGILPDFQHLYDEELNFYKNRPTLH